MNRLLLSRSSRSLLSVPSRGLRAACVLERLPVVTPTPAAWENAAAEFRRRVEARFLKPIPSEWTDGASSSSSSSKDNKDKDSTPTEDDAFASQFKPAPRTTEADAKRDTLSLNRALEKRLYLLVRSSSSSSSSNSKNHSKSWQFPTVEYDASSDASLRAAAERACPAVNGKVYFVGNAPMHHVDKELFLFKAQLVQGELDASQTSGKLEYAWVTRSELAEFMGEAEAKKVVDALWE
jgi:large subunit ribosomal protein L46